MFYRHEQFKKPSLVTCSKCDQLRAKIDIAKQEGDSDLLLDLENELTKVNQI